MDSLLIAVGVMSSALGAAATLFAWNLVREHRRREAARVQLLSGLTFPDGVPVAEFPSEPAPAAVNATDALFREPERSGASSRRTLALAAVCGAATIVVGTYAWMFGASTTAAPATATAAMTTTATEAVAAPAKRPDARVELLALDHDATPKAFVVSGRLRNPVDGASLQDVVVVVDVFDKTGRVLTSARAPLGRPVLNAGESSAFSVSASGAANVARYRVEFHVKGGEPLAQIDRRNEELRSRSQ